MDVIKTTTGVKEITVERDGVTAGVIRFNPSDVLFAEKFYHLVGEFEEKMEEYEARSNAIEKNTSLDDNHLPVNMDERLALLREACLFVRERIDHLFGAGTSQAAFGETLVLDVFNQFFEGVTPFVQHARAEKLAQYAPVKKRVSSHKVGKK